MKGNEMLRWLVFPLLACVLLLHMPVKAATVDFTAKMTELAAKYPNGKYWNHVGMDTDNSDGYTDTPCALHATKGIHVYGTNGCTCNHFQNTHGGTTTQCMGFAYKLGYDVFGQTGWTQHLTGGVTDILPGDIVRIGGSHSVFVTARSGNIITVAEANYNPGCQISWGRTIDLTQIVITNYERADNYAVVLGSAQATTEATTQASTEATTTETATEASVPVNGSGFVKASDGVHRCYYQNGKLIKKQWFTLDGEDYYANEDGWILLSQWLYKGNTLVYVKSDGAVAKNELVKIGSNTYYFKANGKRSAGFKKYNGVYYYCNKKGIIQKKKWIIKGKKRYYVQKNGVRAQSKTVKIKGVTYYFNASGKMVRNKKVTYQGVRYRANAWGRCSVIG